MSLAIGDWLISSPSPLPSSWEWDWLKVGSGKLAPLTTNQSCSQSNLINITKDTSIARNLKDFRNSVSEIGPKIKYIFLTIDLSTTVMSSLSFLVLIFWVFFPLFLVHLAKGLLILLIFSKNQLLVLLILLFSILFISVLTFHLYYIFSLVALGLVCYSFSSSLSCKVRLLIWALVSFYSIYS